VNRQTRALLTIVIVAILLVPLCRSRFLAPATEEGARSRSFSPKTGSASGAPPARGGTLTVTSRSEPRSFNRMASQALPTELFTLLTQAKLVRINRSTGLLEPWLAERWSSSDDGLTHTFTLRENIKWSDGVPFSAADVLFSFEAVYQGGVLGSAVSVGEKPLTATSPDPRTIVVRYPAPLAPGVRLLDNLVILPKHKLEGALRAGKFNEAWPSSTPPGELAGLGPFVLARYEPGRNLVYDRNPHYWRTDDRGQALPYLDRIVVEIVPQQDAEIVRLQGGQTDAMQSSLRATDVTAFRRLSEEGKVQLLDLGVATESTHFFFNLRPEKWSADRRGAWLPRKEFRKAISHAVDREAFANTVFLGEAVPVHGPITPGNRDWFWPDVPRYQYSLDQARTLLEGIGLRNRDSDEWLEDEKGTEARFALEIFGGNAIIERTAEVLRDDLSKVGIAVDVVPLEANTVIEHVRTGEYDAVLVAFQLTDLDPAISQDFWTSSGASHMWYPSQKTPATDWEREIDALIHKQAVTPDPAERKKIFNEVQRIFSDQLPMLYFAAPRVYVALSPRVTHTTPAAQPPQVLWNAEAIAVRPAATRPSS
jgi:peptide/nickel transport system substrate-binding protein